LRFGFARCDDFAALARILSLQACEPARISFAGELDKSAFGEFCRIAGAWGRIEPCLVIAEELAWVSDPGKAPRGWLELVTGGLKYGIDICSITQRPSEADKTALSQATMVRCFQMERVADQKYMAGELGVDVDRVAALAPLSYLEKNRRTRQVAESRVTF
jgi:hypothetical protein